MSSQKDMNLFTKDDNSFKNKFFLLMDLLVSNQFSSKAECAIFLIIYYIQTLSSFFSKNIDVFDSKNSKTDEFLNYVLRVARVKGLFQSNYEDFQAIFFVLLIVLVICIIYFIICIAKIGKKTFYSIHHMILNYIIKVFIYILYNIYIDLAMSNFCFESDASNNPHFDNVTCKFSEKISILVGSFFVIIVATLINFFIQQYYTDSFYLSHSPYAKIACGYESLMSLNSFLTSLLMVEVKYFSKELFLIYNLASSFLLYNFYSNTFVYYCQETNVLAWLFHVLYCWTSIFFLIFAFIDFNEKGLVYIITSFIVVYFAYTLNYKNEEKIMLAIPFYKIRNKHFILYYLKNITSKINSMNKNLEDKAILSGILQMHYIECPNPSCITKTKSHVYLPISDEWSDRTKPPIQDKVFLLNFVIIVMNYFISQNYYSPELIINQSLYHLEILGNFCQAMYYYRKAKEMKMSTQDSFTFFRLKSAIQRTLMSNFKEANQPCSQLDELNVTQYFKYSDLSQRLFDEMGNDVTYLLEFWKTFRQAQAEMNQVIDFNKIFSLTDKIRITKMKVETTWKKLYDIFNGCNDLFDLYLCYTEQINDDDLLKRNLEEIKRKSENIAEFIEQNYYSLLFNKDTGIIICNGDKGNEGTIEKTNNEIESIFSYKPEELKGMNVNKLMPKLFAENHCEYMSTYFQIGEKKVIDQKPMKSFGKDKESSLILLKIGIKLFPMLNDSVYFVGMLIKENIDDIILIDRQFIIQGMSAKLMNILQIRNKNLFVDNEIPFYLICKKFVNFYKIFLHSKKKKKVKAEISSSSYTNSDDLQEALSDEENKENLNTNANGPGSDRKTPNEDDDAESVENIEINENIELEYEIKIPQFIYDYAESEERKEKRAQTLIRNETITDNTNIISNNLIQEAQENIEDEESDLLNEENPKRMKKDTTIIDSIIKKTPDDTSKNQSLLIEISGAGRRISGLSQITHKNTNTGGIVDTFNKKSDEEKTFFANIKKAKEMFENAEFSELEDFIDTVDQETGVADFKFNFTFDRYKFGQRQNAFVVRCIDNKNDGGKSDSNSVGEENDMKIVRCRKEKNEALKTEYEILESEKIEIINKVDDFIKLSIENKEFQEILEKSKREIFEMSVIHGHKREDMVEDENSSQSSQAGYNADLCKKNHIEEIRANLMENVSNFYTLKYIRFVTGCIFIATIIFVAILLTNSISTKNNLKMTAQLSNQLGSTSYWISCILSSVISLKALMMSVSEPDFGAILNTFITPQDKYFDFLCVISSQWYNETFDTFGELERKIGYYLDDPEEFWGMQNVTYNLIGIYDVESFPLAVNQILTDINSLMKNKFFSYDKDIINQQKEQDRELLRYIFYLSIENNYDNILPSQFDKLRTIPLSLNKYNKNLKPTIIFIVTIYFIVILILALVYCFLLYKTNKNMGEGLEKVAKIKLEKIEETIKRIEFFYDMLKKYRDKDYKQMTLGSTIGLKDINGTIESAKPGEVQNNKKEIGLSSSSYGSENKKHKKLDILNLSYLQVAFIIIAECAFLIPLFILLINMITSTNKIILAQNFLMNKLLVAAVKTVEIKCKIVSCKTTVDLDYEDLVNQTEIQKVIQGINTFPELNEYYNEKFLINACDAAFNDSSSQIYKECQEDVLIQSANNTDSLLKLINELSDALEKEFTLYQEKKNQTNNTDDSGSEEGDNNEGSEEGDNNEGSEDGDNNEGSEDGDNNEGSGDGDNNEGSGDGDNNEGSGDGDNNEGSGDGDNNEGSGGGSHVPPDQRPESEFRAVELLSSDNFKSLEKTFYSYIGPVLYSVRIVVDESLNNYLNVKMIIVIIVSSVFSLFILIICIYINTAFITRIIHLLSVSRCILKIIPTSVINNTQELENWIENKY